MRPIIFFHRPRLSTLRFRYRHETVGGRRARRGAAASRRRSASAERRGSPSGRPGPPEKWPGEYCRWRVGVRSSRGGRAPMRTKRVRRGQHFSARCARCQESYHPRIAYQLGQHVSGSGAGVFGAYLAGGLKNATPRPCAPPSHVSDPRPHPRPRLDQLCGVRPFRPLLVRNRALGRHRQGRPRPDRALVARPLVLRRRARPRRDGPVCVAPHLAPGRRPRVQGRGRARVRGRRVGRRSAHARLHAAAQRAPLARLVFGDSNRFALDGRVHGMGERGGGEGDRARTPVRPPLPPFQPYVIAFSQYPGLYPYNDAQGIKGGQGRVAVFRCHARPSHPPTHPRPALS